MVWELLYLIIPLFYVFTTQMKPGMILSRILFFAGTIMYFVFIVLHFSETKEEAIHIELIPIILSVIILAAYIMIGQACEAGIIQHYRRRSERGREGEREVSSSYHENRTYSGNMMRSTGYRVVKTNADYDIEWNSQILLWSQYTVATLIFFMGLALISWTGFQWFAVAAPAVGGIIAVIMRGDIEAYLKKSASYIVEEKEDEREKALERNAIQLGNGYYYFPVKSDSQSFVIQVCSKYSDIGPVGVAFKIENGEGAFAIEKEKYYYKEDLEKSKLFFIKGEQLEYWKDVDKAAVFSEFLKHYLEKHKSLSFN